jgi:hypothetical protein
VAVRILGLWWFPHRSAQVFVVAVWMMSYTGKRRLSGRYVRGLAVLAVVLCWNSFKFPLRLVAEKPYRPFCPAEPQRLADIARGIDYVIDTTGPIKVSSNLVPHLYMRNDVHLFNNSDIEAEWYFYEKQPYGDGWPVNGRFIDRLDMQIHNSGGYDFVIDTPTLLFTLRSSVTY